MIAILVSSNVNNIKKMYDVRLVSNNLNNIKKMHDAILVSNNLSIKRCIMQYSLAIIGALKRCMMQYKLAVIETINYRYLFRVMACNAISTSSFSIVLNTIVITWCFSGCQSCCRLSWNRSNVTTILQKSRVSCRKIWSDVRFEGR